MRSRPGEGSRATYVAYDIPTIHLVHYARDDRKQAENRMEGVAPSCFPFQPLSAQSAIYFISLVGCASAENLLTSVRCPGIVLGGGRPKLKSTYSAGETGIRLPILFPDHPGLKVRLEKIYHEESEANDVGVDEVNHSEGE